MAPNSFGPAGWKNRERRFPKRIEGPRLRVPKRLRIRNADWLVLKEAALDASWVGVKSFYQMGIRGITFPTLRMIQVSNSLDPYMTEITALHELLHACFPMRKPLCSARMEERIVANIAPVLLQILKQCRWRKPRATKKKPMPRVRSVPVRRRKAR